MERALADPPRTTPVKYSCAGLVDEAVTAADSVRAHYRDVFDCLSSADLDALSRRAAGAVAREGMFFRNPVGDDPFRLDVVPRILTGGEWAALEAGLAQRVQALNAFVVDAYAGRRIVESGRVPGRVIDGAVRFEPDACQIPVPAGIHIGVAGMDVVRTQTGELQVLEDNLRTPSGCTYAECARDIVDETLPMALPDRIDEPAAHVLLGEALRAAAPDGGGDASIALLSDGPANSAWWEHSRLAAQLDVPVVTPEDMESRGGKLIARLGPDGRAVPVDVIYRRTDEDRLRDENGEPTWLAELLLGPCREGRVACVNSFGTGIADDKLVHSYVEEMIRFYLGEEPLLRSVPTYDPAEPSVRETILERMDELVVKPRDGYGGSGVVVCAHANDEDRRRAAHLIRTQPEHFVAQETVVFSTHPTLADGELQTRHVDLRPFVYFGSGGPRVLPGGLTRVALDPGALVVNSSQNGGGKATWVLP